MPKIKRLSEIILSREFSSVSTFRNGRLQYDEVYDLIPSICFNIYGIHEDASDEEVDAFDNGDYTNVQSVGYLRGKLILGKIMDMLANDIYTLCDDNSADLEYVYSALSDEGQPLYNKDAYEHIKDIFYIDELYINEEYQNNGYGTMLLKYLPQLIIKEMHVIPDIIAYLPPFLDHEKEVDEDAITQSKFIMAHLEKKLYRDPQPPKDNIVLFPLVNGVTDDQINYMLGRRQAGKSYPEHLRNKRLFDFYRKNGFRESGSSGLMYWHVDVMEVEPFDFE